MKLMKNALVILAGGKGSRMGSITPKQFNYYGKHSFVEYLLNNASVEKYDNYVLRHILLSILYS